MMPMVGSIVMTNQNHPVTNHGVALLRTQLRTLIMIRKSIAKIACFIRAADGYG